MGRRAAYPRRRPTGAGVRLTLARGDDGPSTRRQVDRFARDTAAPRARRRGRWPARAAVGAGVESGAVGTARAAIVVRGGAGVSRADAARAADRKRRPVRRIWRRVWHVLADPL